MSFDYGLIFVILMTIVKSVGNGDSAKLICYSLLFLVIPCILCVTVNFLAAGAIFLSK